MKVHSDTKDRKRNVSNVRNKNCQKDFYNFTSEDGRFTKCFRSYKVLIDVQFKRWKYMLDKSINACFRKVRVKKRVEKYTIVKLMAE